MKIRFTSNDEIVNWNEVKQILNEEKENSRKVLNKIGALNLFSSNSTFSSNQITSLLDFRKVGISYKSIFIFI